MRISPLLHTLIVSCIVVCLAIRCTVRPSYVLDREQMKSITRDMLMTDAYLMDLRLEDSIASYYYEGVLAKHSVSRAVYDSSLVWYGEHSPLYMSIFEELQREFEVSVALSDSLYNDSIQSNRLRYIATASDWGTHQRIRLSPSTRFYTVQSDLSSDQYHGGDTLHLRLRTTPLLTDGEELYARALLMDSSRYLHWSQSLDLAHRDSVSHLLTLVLPDSVPAYGTLRLQLMYMSGSAVRRRLPLYLDSIALYKYVPPLLGVDADSLFHPNSSSEEMTLSQLSEEAVETSPSQYTLE